MLQSTRIFKRLAGFTLTIALAAGLGGCAGQLPNADTLESAGFGLLADGPDSEASPHAKGHRGGHLGMPMLGMFMRDLNLSDAQKAQFKALFEQARAQHQTQRPDFKAIKEQFKQAFLSESFDAVALRSQVQSQAPDPAVISRHMAEHLLKAWQILTPQQQSKLVSRLDQMEARMQKFAAQGPAQGPHRDQLQKLAQQLQLSAEQQAQIQALWSASKPERTERHQQLKALKQSMLTELGNANPSVERMAGLIAPLAAKGQGQLGSHLDKMAGLHGILSSAQRAQLVSMMEQKHQARRGHSRR
ncbi:MAG: hypothetical protein CVV27_08655 [Candidatus Melainabacteria bacterium HGW-Melainabacteria-1]|nr:MAG: hypothetical protein CVV27_08655 [Candidatus Melainabacteria bacterium HGW-Melainabacteria-1]